MRTAIQAECNSFNKEQRQYHVTCTNLGNYETVLQRSAAAYRADKQPTLVQIYDAATMEMIQSGAVIPAWQFLRRYDGKSQSWDYPRAVRQYYGDEKGRLYAVPYNISTILLFVNDNALAHAHVAQPPQTWEEFERTLQQLKDAGFSCPFAFRLDSWWWLEEVSAVSGVPIASLGNGFAGIAASYNFDHGPHTRVMQMLLHWQRRGWAILYGNSAIGSPERAFAGGQCAMVLEGSGTAGLSAKMAKDHFHISVHPMPSFSGRPRYGSAPGGAALWIMKGHSDATYRAAAAFLAYIRSPVQQVKFARATGFLPLSRAARQQFAVGTANTLEGRAVAEAVASLDGAAADHSNSFRLGFFARFRSVWKEEMQRAFAGVLPIDTALQSAQRRGNDLLRRFQQIYGGNSLAQPLQ